METTTVRLLDLMCPEHVQAAARWWPAGFDLKTSCEKCTAGLASQPGGKVLSTLTTAQVDRHAAIHEAGHAVIGVLTGHPLVRVYIRDGAVGGQEPAGEVLWGPWTAPALEHLATVWAGQVAGMRWLGEAGLKTRANQMDARFLAWRDSAEASHWCTNQGLPPGSGLDLATELVDQHWARIARLADVLVERGSLTGAEATDIIGF